MKSRLFEINKTKDEHKLVKFECLQDVENYCKELCVKYGIPETRIEWAPTATRRYGQANHRQQLITLSKQPIEHNLHKTEAIIDLLLHEIAHLLVGPKHRHDAVWKAKCIEIGAVPEATIKQYDEARKLPVPSKYTYRCPNCGKLVYTNYKKRLQACYECCHKYNNGKWTSEYVFELIERDK